MTGHMRHPGTGALIASVLFASIAGLSTDAPEGADRLATITLAALLGLTLRNTALIPVRRDVASRLEFFLSQGTWSGVWMALIVPGLGAFGYTGWDYWIGGLVGGAFYKAFLTFIAKPHAPPDFIQPGPAPRRLDLGFAVAPPVLATALAVFRVSLGFVTLAATIAMLGAPLRGQVSGHAAYPRIRALVLGLILLLAGLSVWLLVRSQSVPP